MPNFTINKEAAFYLKKAASVDIKNMIIYFFSVVQQLVVADAYNRLIWFGI